MRLKRNRLNKYFLRPAIQKKDKESSTYLEYGEPVLIEAEMWTAGGKLQSEMYGSRLPNIRNLRINGGYREVPGKNGKLVYQLDSGANISVNDGVCIYSDADPDYKVIAVYPYCFLTLEVEKL